MHFGTMLLFDVAMELRPFLGLDTDRHNRCFVSIFDILVLG